MKKRKEEKERPIIEACAIGGLCQGKCKDLHRIGCPAFYRFVWEPLKKRSGKKLKRQLRKKEV